MSKHEVMASGGRQPTEHEPEPDDRWSVGALETLLVQNVAMTIFAATVSHLIRQDPTLFRAPIPLSPAILLEIALWGGGLGLVFAYLSLAAASGAGLKVVWMIGSPPLALAVLLTAPSLAVAALFAPFVVALIWG